MAHTHAADQRGQLTQQIDSLDVEIDALNLSLAALTDIAARLDERVTRIDGGPPPRAEGASYSNTAGEDALRFPTPSGVAGLVYVSTRRTQEARERVTQISDMITDLIERLDRAI